MEQFCEIYDVKLLETRITEVSEEEKLAYSIIAILTSFSGKLYRSHRFSNIKQQLKNIEIDDNYKCPLVSTNTIVN